MCEIILASIKTSFTARMPNCISSLKKNIQRDFMILALQVCIPNLRQKFRYSLGASRMQINWDIGIPHANLQMLYIPLVMPNRGWKKLDDSMDTYATY